MEARAQIKLIAAIAVIGGLFLTYNGHQEKERLAKLEKEGVTVEGFIEGGEWRNERLSRNCKLDVSIIPQKVVPVKQTFQVTSPFFSAHANDTKVTHPVVQVRYLPSNIQGSAIIVGGSTDSTAFFSAGIGAFVIGLLTLGIMFLFKW